MEALARCIEVKIEDVFQLRSDKYFMGAELLQRFNASMDYSMCSPPCWP